MYIKINLLPPEIKVRWERERKKRTVLLTAGAVLAIFIVIYSMLVLTTFQVRAGVARLQKERTELESKIPALQQYAQLQNQVEQAEGLIKEAVGTPLAWKSILENIGLYIPVNVWLTDLSFTNENDEDKRSTNFNSNTASNQAAVNDLAKNVQDIAKAIQGVKNGTEQSQAAPEPGGELTIRGYAFEYAAVTQWLEQICQIPELTNVNCQFSSKEELNGESVIHFEIKALVLSGQPDG